MVHLSRTPAETLAAGGMTLLMPSAQRSETRMLVQLKLVADLRLLIRF